MAGAFQLRERWTDLGSDADSGHHYLKGVQHGIIFRVYQI